MKILTLVCSVGLILSLEVVVSKVNQYELFLNKAKTIGLITSNEEVVSQTVDNLLEGHKNKEKILTLLKNTFNHSDTLHSLVTQMNTDSINFTLNEIWSWIISSVIFALLIFLIELSEKSKNKIKSVWGRLRIRS